MITEFKCPTCPICHKPSSFFIEDEILATRIKAWMANPVEHIQFALPNLAVSMREQLITGAHSKCFDGLFPPEEEKETRVIRGPIPLGELGHTLEELRAALEGHLVRTERPVTEDEKDAYHTESDCFGGEGIVVDVYEEDDKTWICVDWGFGWVIDEKTTILFLKGE